MVGSTPQIETQNPRQTHQRQHKRCRLNLASTIYPRWHVKYAFGCQATKHRRHVRQSTIQSCFSALNGLSAVRVQSLPQLEAQILRFRRTCGNTNVVNVVGSPHCTTALIMPLEAKRRNAFRHKRLQALRKHCGHTPMNSACFYGRILNPLFSLPV